MDIVNQCSLPLNGVFEKSFRLMDNANELDGDALLARRGGIPSSVVQETEDEQRAISNLIIFSLLMFILPLSTMFILARFLFQDYLHWNTSDAWLWAGIIGVILTVILMIAFAWVAYREEVEGVEKKKKSG